MECLLTDKQDQVNLNSKGKTFTMFGPVTHRKGSSLSRVQDQHSGLVPRLMNEVLGQFGSRMDSGLHKSCSITFSMFQIYNERIYDLLQVVVY